MVGLKTAEEITFSHIRELLWNVLPSDIGEAGRGKIIQRLKQVHWQPIQLSYAKVQRQYLAQEASTFLVSQQTTEKYLSVIALFCFSFSKHLLQATVRKCVLGWLDLRSDPLQQFLWHTLRGRDHLILHTSH